MSRFARVFGLTEAQGQTTPPEDAMRDDSSGFLKQPNALAAALLLAASCSGGPAAAPSAVNLSDTEGLAARVWKPPQRPERYLYVATLAKSASDPDFVAVVGADPRQADYGKIVNRIDMPNVGDELHHFGYSADQERLIVPGLFSSRIHVFEIGRDRKSMQLLHVNEQLVADSGFIIPHSVISTGSGKSLVTMIGAASGTTQPGGIVEIDDKTGHSRMSSARALCAAPATPRPDTCMTSIRSAPRRIAGSAPPSGRRRCAAAGSSRPASATRSPSGTRSFLPG